jgi:multiple antibiotic resistance protein
MPETVADFVRAVMLALATLLPLINPPGSAPIFLSMTPGASDPERTALAVRVARNSFVLLVVAMLAGSYVLIFFGLSLAVVKIAGGLLVIATAWHLIRSEQSPDATMVAPSPLRPDHDIGSHSFYPLTFPVTIGPGSISVAMTLGAGARVAEVADVTKVLGVVVGIVLVSSTIYLCYRFAARLLRALGRSGTGVLLRLSAFILLSIGVQILCDGVAERFGLPPVRLR